MSPQTRRRICVDESQNDALYNFLMSRCCWKIVQRPGSGRHQIMLCCLPWFSHLALCLQFCVVHMDGLRPARQSICRAKAASFLSAALLALSSLLQRLRESRGELNSAPLVRVLLKAHAALATSPESLAALTGRFGAVAHHPLLQVSSRQTSVLALEGASGQSGPP